MQTDFRESYDKKITKNFLIIGYLHILLFIPLALYFKTELVIAILGPILSLIGPTISYKIYQGQNISRILIGFSYMCLSAVAIHLGKGMIEMHFHIFLVLSVLIVYGRQLPILTSLLTVAVHHIAFFFILPRSLFNYAAGFEIVIIHALFAIFQAIGCMAIAKKFSTFLFIQSEFLTNLKSSSELNNGLSKSIHSIVLNINRSFSEEVEKLKDTTNYLIQIESSVKNSYLKISETCNNTKECTNVAKDGESSIEELSQSMNRIDQSNQLMTETLLENSKQIEDIGKTITQISDKTGVINDIAFQTKLLSFNASVEAARAGENGKGFAVVAEEVGALANMSAKASEEINKLIKESYDKIKLFLELSQKQVGEITQEGKKVNALGSQKTKESILSIKKLVENLNTNASSMIYATSEAKKQEDEIKNITFNINEVQRINYTNQSIIKDLAQMANELNDQSKHLGGIVKNIESLLGDDNQNNQNAA